MVEIITTKRMIDTVNRKIEKFHFDKEKGLSRFGSEKERTYYGYLGEQIVMAYLGINIDNDDHNYDLTYKEFKLEVKSISCKFKPLQHFLCTVNSYNLTGIHKQYADYYVFTRILNDKSKGWILGYIDCDKFFKIGRFVPKGTELVKDVRFVKANATVLEINRLKPIQELRSL